MENLEVNTPCVTRLLLENLMQKETVRVIRFSPFLRVPLPDASYVVDSLASGRVTLRFRK